MKFALRLTLKRKIVSMDKWIQLLAYSLATGAEAIAAVIIGAAGVQFALKSFYRLFIFWRIVEDSESDTFVMRMHFGSWLTVALDFLIAADILHTVVAPGWNEIGKLTSVIFLRTLLVYFLHMEFKQDKNREAQP